MFSNFVVSHLADLPTVWPHPGGPETPREFMEELQAVHSRYDGLLTFGLGQTVALADAGRFSFDFKDANRDKENELNVLGFGTNMLHGVKLIAAYDAHSRTKHEAFGGAMWGHGSNVWKLITANIRSVGGKPGRLGVVFNAHLVILRVVNHNDCLEHDERTIPTSEFLQNTNLSLSLNSLASKNALTFFITNHKKLRITHLHLSMLSAYHSTTDSDVVDIENSFIDELKTLRSLQISVTAPAGNDCVNEGAVYPGLLPTILVASALDLV